MSAEYKEFANIISTEYTSYYTSNSLCLLVRASYIWPSSILSCRSAVLNTATKGGSPVVWKHPQTQKRLRWALTATWRVSKKTIVIAHLNYKHGCNTHVCLKMYQSDYSSRFWLVQHSFGVWYMASLAHVHHAYDEHHRRWQVRPSNSVCRMSRPACICGKCSYHARWR